MKRLRATQREQAKLQKKDEAKLPQKTVREWDKSVVKVDNDLISGSKTVIAQKHRFAEL